MATYSQETWTAWMRAALLGDKEAYRLLLLELKPWLTGFFRKRIAPDYVDDLVQDTLMTVHAKRHTYDTQQPFAPWLAAVARHRLVDHYRRYGRRQEVELEDDVLDDTDAGGAADAAHDVALMLKTLSPQQAEAIRLVKLQEHSIDEAAAKTGQSVASIKVLVHRGMKKLMAAAGLAEASKPL